MELATRAVLYFQPLLQTRTFTLKISSWPLMDLGNAPAKTLMRICQTLLEFSFLVEHNDPTRTLPVSQIASDPGGDHAHLLIWIAKVMKTPQGHDMLLQVLDP
jgi:hypothetical protein